MPGGGGRKPNGAAEGVVEGGEKDGLDCGDVSGCAGEKVQL